MNCSTFKSASLTVRILPASVYQHTKSSETNLRLSSHKRSQTSRECHLDTTDEVNMSRKRLTKSSGTNLLRLRREATLKRASKALSKRYSLSTTTTERQKTSSNGTIKNKNLTPEKEGSTGLGQRLFLLFNSQETTPLDSSGSSTMAQMNKWMITLTWKCKIFRLKAQSDKGTG